MKCPECGEELESGALFCWSCGCKIGNGGATARYCMSCGEPLESGSKFCTNCGSKCGDTDNDTDDIYLDDEETEEYSEEAEGVVEFGAHKDGLFSKIKRLLIGVWDRLDGYSRFCVELMAMEVYCLMLSIIAHNTLRDVMAVLQIVTLGVLYCIHNKVLIHGAKPVHSRLLWVLLIVLNIIFIASFRVG